MKDANGFHVDITENPRAQQTRTAIRMNKAAMMVSPSGVSISLIQHIK